MSENEQTNTAIEIPANISVREFAQAIDSSPIEVIKTLMANGVMANINQHIDFDTAAIVAAEMGFEVSLETPELETEEEIGEIPLWRQVLEDEDPEELEQRPPVVTILGHVDHGKTTLLDAIRHTNVVGDESGGITQHIGAYQITHNKKKITFLDTPGHSAFTAMRARGAQGADIVVLVVAADDGVMPQTREAIAHAKAAQVPIIVAMNKIDLQTANPDRAKKQIADIGLIPDEWEGETIVVPISAKEQTGLEDLLEAISLVSDNMEIRANPEGSVLGTVIEAEVDRSRGVMTTLLIQNGSLHVGDVVIAGNTYGKLKAMFDYRGNDINLAGPATPVSVMGLNDVPRAGDIFRVIGSEKQARAVVEERIRDMEEIKAGRAQAVTLEQLFDQFKSGDVRELRLILKADVQGSLEPIVSSLENMEIREIGINILHAETGNIGENDIMLASASNAIVIGFNVEADTAARRLADAELVSVRLYDIIYRLTEDVEKALQGLLEPEEVEKVLGHAEVRAIFNIRKVGKIAGCYVTDGEIRRNGRIRVVRDDEELFSGEIGSLKHLQEDVREIRKGFECGISVKGFNDFEEGDILECYILEIAPVI